MPAVVPFLPTIFGGLAAASSVKGSLDARKGQKEQREQSARIAAEARASQPQAERDASELFTRKRRSRSPGFTDGAVSAGAGTTGAYLGQ